MEINPSQNGWLSKFEKDFALKCIDVASADDFYEKCQETGLVYGFLVDFWLQNNEKPNDLNTKERTKFAFVAALFVLYKFRTKTNDFALFLLKLHQFYAKIIKNDDFLNKILQNSVYEKLEESLKNRIDTNHDIFTKGFSKISTNAFLFLDVLAFDAFLENPELSKKHLKFLERVTVYFIKDALEQITEKNEHEEMVLKMFKSSLRYTNFTKDFFDDLSEVFTTHQPSYLEKLYWLDVIIILLFDTDKLSDAHALYIGKINSFFNLDKDIQNTGKQYFNYLEKNKNELPFFQKKNSISLFYNNTQNRIEELVQRNSKRLALELKESKDLALLISKATQKNLTAEEKKRMKKQLLDICKTVPSLTIFLLPGGAFLLPIFVKFIPRILPSAFNENFKE